jgi:hypothetical protein
MVRGPIPSPGRGPRNQFCKHPLKNSLFSACFANYFFLEKKLGLRFLEYYIVLTEKFLNTRVDNILLIIGGKTVDNTLK